MWVTALTVVAIVCAAVGLALWFGQAAMLFPAPPRGRQPAYPDRLVRAGDVAFIYFPAARVVAYFHGNGEDLADSIPMISLLRTLGVGVLAVEYPGYGVAAGKPSEQSAYAAAESALLWLRTEQGIDRDRVALLGQSLGSGVATEMARRELGARLVLVSPFTSVAQMGRRMLPFLPASLVRDEFDTESKAKGISIPVLIIHGTEDEVVPFAMGERLASVFPQARMVSVEGGMHNDLLSTHAIAVRDALVPFLKF